MAKKTNAQAQEQLSNLSIPSISELRTLFNGQVIAPGDPGYDEARTVFYGGIDRRPAAIVRVMDAGDVTRVVYLARETGLELAIRSGGHSTAGHSVSDGGIVLDLSNMRDLQIDVEQRTAWAETGLTAGEYTTAAGAHGLATGFGDTGSVGIGGLTLGGGVGYLVRKYGLTIDDLLAAEVVTADGQLLRVDNESHPDLFWAIRGGGGNFGVATRFQFRLHEVGEVYGGILMLPATVDTITGFLAEAEAAPEELSTIANVMKAPPMPFIPEAAHGKFVLLGLMAFSGDPDEGNAVMDRFRALGEPIADMLGPTKYPALFEEPEEEGDFHPMMEGVNLFADEFAETEAKTAISHIEASTAAMSAVQFRVLGGAFARVPNDATAFGHRDRKLMVNVAAMYMDPSQKEEVAAWTRDLAEALYPGETAGYSGFITDEGDRGAIRAYPPATLSRLQEIKRRYDPDNLFRLNHNIAPA